MVSFVHLIFGIIRLWTDRENRVAKSPYGLNDKDIASLPFYSFPGSPKCVVRVSDAEQLAARKRTAIGVDYPAMNPLHSYMSGTRVMTLNGRHLTELSGYTPYRSRGYGY